MSNASSPSLQPSNNLGSGLIAGTTMEPWLGATIIPGATEIPTEDDIKSWRGLFSKFKGLFGFKDSKGQIIENAQDISDRDKRFALDAALEVEDPSRFHEVVAIFSNTFVYAIGFGGTLNSRTFELADDGVISLGSEVTQVRPVTEFVPINVAQEKENMATNEERVNSLIASERTRFTDDDSEWLKGLSEEQLEVLEPVEQEPVAEVTKPLEKPTTPVENTVAEVKEPPTAQEYVDSAPPEIQEVLNEAMRTQSQRRGELVERLTGNSRCDFTKKELTEMAIPQLEKLIKLAQLPDYSGASGGARVTTSDDNVIPTAPEPFPREVA